jgi:hypothetical protein
MFGDFAPPETIRLFGERVLPALTVLTVARAAI